MSEDLGRIRLKAVSSRWVTLRGTTDKGSLVVVHIDEAVAFGAPYRGMPMQVGLGFAFEGEADGQPRDDERAELRALEQQVVDLAAADARLVAVLTVEGLREWVLYADGTAWLGQLAPEITQNVVHDPLWTGLLQLVGMA